MLVYVESLAACLALAYVLLAIYEKRSCWPVAAFSAFLYIYVYYEVKLYLEAALQIFFIIIAFRGFINWNQERNQGLKISKMPLKKHLLGIIVFAAISFLLGNLLVRFTDADLPYIDAAITVFSIYTTFLVSEKILENWLYWIVIDLVASIVYLYKGLYPTAFIFVLYIFLAFQGYRKWKVNCH